VLACADYPSIGNAIEAYLGQGHCQLGVKQVAEEQESAGNATARSSFNAG
jgi:hypothetical protein